MIQLYYKQKQYQRANVHLLTMNTIVDQKICPGMSEQNSADLSGEGTIYIHCTRCQTGVYLDHENGTKCCSYCAHEQPVLSSR